MFYVRYEGRKFFRLLDGCKYYRDRVFKEQLEDGSYRRDTHFFLKHRLELTGPEFTLLGIRPEMQVRYTGKGDAQEAVLIGGTLFRRNEWVTVPLDFDSRADHGADMFIVLGFDFKSPAMTKSDLSEVQDGETILVLRRYGGLGDIVMQSMIFPDIRRQFPHSKIIYAIPKNFHALFEHCTDIDEVMDSTEVDSVLPRLIVSGKYDFIGDISISCARYEVLSIQARGRVDKERPDIWAESMGLTLQDHETCMRLSSDEIEMADLYADHIGIVPCSAAGGRNYPHVQALIDGVVQRGHKALLIHSDDMPVTGCDKLIRPDLRTLMAACSGMKAMLAVDTGPMHIAGVFGTPLVGIFGVTDSRVRLGYYNAVAIQGECVKGKEPCWHDQASFCGRDNSGIATCMYVEPSVIFAALEGLLA